MFGCSNPECPIPDVVHAQPCGIRPSPVEERKPLSAEDRRLIDGAKAHMSNIPDGHIPWPEETPNDR
jgi:hypothetical protein